MKLLITSRFNSEQGQASLFLLFGVTLSLFALAVLLFRLGDAHEMRTNTQSAADAAALAAVGDIEDRAAEAIVNNTLPHGVGWQKSTGKPAAQNYAERNDGKLTKIRASDNNMGMSGNIVRVEVQGDRCQRELQDDGSVKWNHRECPDKEEIEEAERRGEEIPTLTGNAAATAEVTLPECELRQWTDWLGVTHSYVVCRKEGSGEAFRRVWTKYQAKQMSEVKLVDQEGQWIYSELVGGPGSGLYPCDAVGGQKITRQMCETHEAILEKWGAALERYDMHCYRPQEDGGDHPRGQACDYMVASLGQLPNDQMKKTANAAVQWMIDNHEKLDIKYVMWDHYIWNPSRDPEGEWSQVRRRVEERHSITQNHMDHIHVSVSS